MSPRMREQEYERGFSAAVNVSSATTSLVIPPSNALIIYSLASGGVSIGALFLAGYLPGALMGLAIMTAAGAIARRRGYPTDARVCVREVAARFWVALPSLLLVVVVMGGIVAGLFTATEAGAIAVLYNGFLALFVHRETSVNELPGILIDAATTTSIVLLLVVTSTALAWVLAYERIPQAVSEALAALTRSPWIALLAINVILLAVGAVLFLGCSVAGARIEDVSRALLPLYVAMLVVLALVTLVPDLALPRFFGF